MTRPFLFNKLLDAMIANGKALNAAMYHEIDAVIDPKDTRHYLLRALKSLPVGKKHGGGYKRVCHLSADLVVHSRFQHAEFNHVPVS